MLEFLERMETRGAASRPAATASSSPGSGAGFIAPLVGAKLIQEVVAVAACVERLHPDVRFVSEIGGEDMKTIFFTATGRRQVQAGLHAVGLQRRHRAPSSRRPRASCRCPASGWPRCPTPGMSLHKVSSKCGIFAETDANTLVKTGVPVEEIIASLFEAVVYQNLATLTKGNTPMPEVLLLGGPNLFFKGLQEAWRHHLAKLWTQRKVDAARGPRPRLAHHRARPRRSTTPASAASRSARARSREVGVYQGRDKLEWWVDEGQHEQKAKDGGKAPGRRRRRSGDVRRREYGAGPRRRGGADGAARAHDRDARAARLRLRQHHRQGRRALAGARAALHLLRAVQGQSRSRMPSRCSARCARPGSPRWPGSRSPATARISSTDVLGADVARGGDGGARHRRAALLSPTPT